MKELNKKLTVGDMIKFLKGYPYDSFLCTDEEHTLMYVTPNDSKKMIGHVRIPQQEWDN